MGFWGSKVPGRGKGRTSGKEKAWLEEGQERREDGRRCHRGVSDQVLRGIVV